RDDPIERWLPDFRYHTYLGSITLRSLMSHMSGLGRDWPAGDASGAWPRALVGGGPPPINNLDFPSLEMVLEAISETAPISAPYVYPVYSNTGYSLLGMANVAANRASEGRGAPTSHAGLVERDIFGPLAFNGTSFLPNDDTIQRLVVASVAPDEVDLDFQDLSNPACGQMSSLRDLVRASQMLLDPEREGQVSVISERTLSEWLRPIHSWFDGFSEVGAVWEIYSSKDSYGRTQKLYQKLGELAGHHTALTLNPASSYAIVILTTGPTSQTTDLTNFVIKRIQSVFDEEASAAARSTFEGTWESDDSLSRVQIAVQNGALFVREYILNGTDVLGVLQNASMPKPLALWTLAPGEFR
ncbi:beta-lactamase transpeptidase-like protein, partial [Coniophora puteana RWD-64-598 SS2]